ncbi:hypothetical protein AZE42_03790 [Rhizopogon vesiculosus]|uniref:Uncharacterized protein n=1 Tax=Rhizopogon vesiculosus TaxID=180088 RepID=A0A1J8PGC6_9AGAM|nr:hypothetical protein AZE42_03790 [Rhizopogon vesiculosus]
MLSTWRLSSSSMHFDEVKDLAKVNEKYTILSPFDITNKILGPYMFGPNAQKTLDDRMELYFRDHSCIPLFIQVTNVTIPELDETLTVSTGNLYQDPALCG